MYRVSKVLNNNGVIAINMEENQEYVLLGKGVGFGKKVSQRFEMPSGAPFTDWLRRQNAVRQKSWQKVWRRSSLRSQTRS